LQSIRDHLARHDFRPLFIEQLGWDAASGELAIQAGDASVALRRVSHKRGLQVFVCKLDPQQLIDRKLLRTVESQVVHHSAEHVVIYYSEELGQQCWQWAATGPAGKRLRHREHPFTSRVPPESVVARIQALAVAFELEDSTSLTDVSARMKGSFNNDAEFSTFFSGARWRALSTTLHKKWTQTRSDDDLNAFLSVHLPLLRWAAKRFARHRLDQEDAVQIGFLALRKAAQKFDPNHGAQFSTYASRALIQWIARLGPVMTDIIKCRSGRFATYRLCERRAERLAARSGHWRGARLLELLTLRKTTQSASVFRAARHIDTLDDPKQPFRRILNDRLDPDPLPIALMIHEECIARIPIMLATLPQRDAAILRKRFGLDGSGHESTLDEIGAVHRLTKERVRQILIRTLEDLRANFDEPAESEKTELPDQTAGRRATVKADGPPNLVCVVAGVMPTTSLATPLASSSRAFTLRSQDAPPPRLFDLTPRGSLSEQRPPEEGSDDPKVLAEDVASVMPAPDADKDTLPRPLSDAELIERAVSEANAEGGILVSDLIATLRLSGARIRTALHDLARSGEVERGPDLRWKRAGTSPPTKSPPTKLAGPAAIQSATSEQPSLFGANH
jgi:RNA polymerase sigma factor (sigma-70 family)